jgi:hypothetical protein
MLADRYVAVWNEKDEERRRTPSPRLARKIGTGRFAALMDALRALDSKD